MSISEATRGSQPNSIQFSARWDRNLVVADGGTANLLITISTSSFKPQNESRAPLDIAFVLDRSGSMSGEKLSLVKQAILAGLEQLRPEDRAALVIYDHEVETIHDLSYCDDRAKSRLRRVLKEVSSRGSTNLSDGWLTGCAQLSPGAARSGRSRIRRALLLTDGQANVGIVEPNELMTHASELRRRGVSTTTLGVGEGFDEVLLSGMAEAGGGNFWYIERPSQLSAFFQHELGELLTVAASELTIVLQLSHGVRAELVNAFPAERNGKQISVAVGDLPAGVELNLVFEVTVKAGAVRSTHPIQIQASWIEQSSDQQQVHGVPVASLILATRFDVDHVQIDQIVAEEVAMQRASQREREAMRLDREGRHVMSRELLHLSAMDLAAAPPSVRVQKLHEQLRDLSSHDSSVGFASGIRKQSTSDAMNRSRGRTEHPDGAGV